MPQGFLGYHASFMLDVVVCALVLVVPTLLLSLYLVKVKRRYQFHRRIQIGLAVVLSLAVILFEIDMRWHGGWRNIVNPPTSPTRVAPEQMVVVGRLLAVHLVFAISTPLLWAATLTLAYRRFSRPPAPNAHSSLHKKLGWLSMLDLVLTSLTGLGFYYAAFIQPTL